MKRGEWPLGSLLGNGPEEGPSMRSLAVKGESWTPVWEEAGEEAVSDIAGREGIHCCIFQMASRKHVFMVRGQELFPK